MLTCIYPALRTTPEHLHKSCNNDCKCFPIICLLIWGITIKIFKNELNWNELLFNFSSRCTPNSKRLGNTALVNGSDTCPMPTYFLKLFWFPCLETKNAFYLSARLRHFQSFSDFLMQFEWYHQEMHDSEFAWFKKSVVVLLEYVVVVHLILK